MTILRLKGLAVAAVAASLVTALLPTHAGAAKPRQTGPVVLGADNVISGTTGYTAVTIPKGAHFPAKTGENPYFRISGRGRFVGALLVQAGNGLLRDGVSLFVGRYSFCDAPACDPVEPTQVLITRGTDREGTLPPGDYRLYLITDGAPASVAMRFDGLTGKTKIVPDVRLDAEVTEPATNIAAPGNLAHSYARSYDFKGVKGFTFKVLSIKGDAWAAGRYGDCIYGSDPLLPAPVGYIAPECPGGLGIWTLDATVRPSRFRIDNYSQTIYDPGEWKVSSFYEAAGLITGADALDVTLDIPSH
ncbi:MAG: hypothetical protein M3323_08300 [Actinomycetota bacterium]|nr:hypothetical protein [Actinomycetota bacterium]